MSISTILEVQYTDIASSTSEELRALGESLRRLTLSNESLSQSNLALTNILSAKSHTLENPAETGTTTLVSSTMLTERTTDRLSMSYPTFPHYTILLTCTLSIASILTRVRRQY